MEAGNISIAYEVNQQLTSEITELKSKYCSSKTKIAILTEKNEILNHLCKEFACKYKEIISKNELIQLQNNINQQSLQRQNNDDINLQQLQLYINVLQQETNELKMKNENLFRENIALCKHNKSLQNKLKNTVEESNQCTQNKYKLQSLCNDLNLQVAKLKFDLNEQNIIISDLQNELEITGYDDVKSVMSNKLQIPRSLCSVPMAYASSVNDGELRETEYFYNTNNQNGSLFLLEKYQLQLMQQDETDTNNSIFINIDEPNITSRLINDTPNLINKFDAKTKLAKTMTEDLMDITLKQEMNDEHVNQLQLLLSRKASEDDIFRDGLDTMNYLFEIKSNICGCNQYNIDTKDVTVLCFEQSKDQMLTFFTSLEERYENVAILGENCYEYLVVITIPTKLITINVLSADK